MEDINLLPGKIKVILDTIHVKLKVLNLALNVLLQSIQILGNAFIHGGNSNFDLLLDRTGNFLGAIQLVYKLGQIFNLAGNNAIIDLEQFNAAIDALDAIVNGSLPLGGLLKECVKD